MSEKTDDPMNLDLAFLKSAAHDLTKDSHVDIRKGLSIFRSVTGTRFAMVDENEVALKDLSHDIASEIRDAAKKHKEDAAEKEKAKYLDPARNPYIKVDPED